MKPTKIIHDLGQSLWLDNITRDLLNSGTLQRYIDEHSVTGLTSIQPSSITPSGTARTTTPTFARRRCGPSRRKICSSTWRWRI